MLCDFWWASAAALDDIGERRRYATQIITLIVAGCFFAGAAFATPPSDGCTVASGGSEIYDGYTYFRVASPPHCGGAWPPDTQATWYAGYCWRGSNSSCNFDVVMRTLCPVGQRWIASISSCIAESKQNGSQHCGSATPNPIALGTGNKYLTEADISSSDINLRRTYNAANANFGFSSLFQREVVSTNKSLFGWLFSFQQKLRVANDSPDVVWAVRQSGKIYEFRRTALSSWMPDADVAEALVELMSATGTRIGWRYFSADESQYENYDPFGILQSIVRTDGKTFILIYTDGTNGVASQRGGYVVDAAGFPAATTLPAGLLLRVNNDFGVGIEYGYDAMSRAVIIGNKADGAVHYTYDSAGNIAATTYPDGKIKTYLYGEASYISAGSLQPNSLTGIIDENGARYASYWYDADGRANDEKLAEGNLANVGRNQIAYNGSVGDINSAAVTDGIGATRIYSFTKLLGINRLTGLSQPAGSGCGAAASAMAYDANGNITSKTDFNGTKSCHAYDLSRNLETARIDGLSAADACPTDIGAFTSTTEASQRKTTTQWHPALSLPIKQAEPKKITISVYNGQPDSTVGNATASCAPTTAVLPDGSPIVVLCKKVEQATTDATGSLGFNATATGTPRTWTYTYNQYGQVLTARNPLNKLTTYAYYSDTTDQHTMGDLQSVTASTGRITQYTRYDKSGRLMRSIDANGTVTDTTYTPRGWVKTVTVTAPGAAAQASLYDYDGVGQLKKAALPDGTALEYTYDAAHRLTSVKDAAGNSVTYTLDNMGNRTGEDLKDPSGTLARSMNRVFDALSRVQEVSGVGQ